MTKYDDKFFSEIRGSSSLEAQDYIYETSLELGPHESGRNNKSRKDYDRSYVLEPGIVYQPRVYKNRFKDSVHHDSGQKSEDLFKSIATVQIDKLERAFKSVIASTTILGDVNQNAIKYLLSLFKKANVKHKNDNSYNKDYLRFMTQSLQQITSLESKTIASFSRLVDQILLAMNTQLSQLKKISPGQLSYIAYLLSKLSIDWSKQNSLFTLLDQFFNKYSKKKNSQNISKHLIAYLPLLGSYARLMHATKINVNEKTLKKMDALYESIGKYFVTMRKQANFIFTDQSIMKDRQAAHLIWQYCAWRYGNTLYNRDDQQHNTLLNYIESFIDKHYYSLEDHEDHNKLYETSLIEKRVVALMDRLLQGYPQLKMSTQRTIGCYAIDISFMEHKIALEVYGPHHFTQDGSIRPQDKFRNDVLRKMGWEVIIISVEEISPLKNHELISLLEKKLQPALKSKRQAFSKQSKKYVPPHRRRKNQDRPSGSRNRFNRPSTSQSQSNQNFWSRSRSRTSRNTSTDYTFRSRRGGPRQ